MKAVVHDQSGGSQKSWKTDDDGFHKRVLRVRVARKHSGEKESDSSDSKEITQIAAKELCANGDCHDANNCREAGEQVAQNGSFCFCKRHGWARF